MQQNRSPNDAIRSVLLSDAATDTVSPLLDVRDLHVEYLSVRGAVRAVDGISFSVAPGEVLGLAGESGSGKSTTALALMRVLHPPAMIRSGEALFKGRDILKMSLPELEQFRWHEISMVFQSAMNALNPVMTIGDQIADTIRAHTKQSQRQALDQARNLLKIVGIDVNRLNAYPHQLSGGMRQRAVIAIALALRPPMMILDEPTTALDVVVQRDILQQIDELRKELDFSMLFITHDLSLLVEFATRIAVMYAGQIIEVAPSRELFNNPLHPYTQGLMSSFPSITGEKKKLIGIPGSPPDMAAPPSGCRFHPRCALVKPMHTQVVPRLREATPGHFVACHLY